MGHTYVQQKKILQHKTEWSRPSSIFWLSYTKSTLNATSGSICAKPLEEKLKYLKVYLKRKNIYRKKVELSIITPALYWDFGYSVYRGWIYPKYQYFFSDLPKSKTQKNNLCYIIVYSTIHQATLNFFKFRFKICTNSEKYKVFMVMVR